MVEVVAERTWGSQGLLGNKFPPQRAARGSQGLLGNKLYPQRAFRVQMWRGGGRERRRGEGEERRREVWEEGRKRRKEM